MASGVDDDSALAGDVDGDEGRGGLSPASGWLAAHGDVMFGWAVRRLGDEHAAEEAVQDALLAAMGSAGSFRGGSSERTWLIGILRHKVLDRLRGDGRRSSAMGRLRERAAAEAEADSGGGDLGEVFEGGFWREAPGGSWPEKEEVRARLWRALDGLPEAMRLAVCLREVDGLETGAVCEILGVSATHLSTLIHRAKVRLRRAVVEGECGDGGAGGDEGETGAGVRDEAAGGSAREEEGTVQREGGVEGGVW